MTYTRILDLGDLTLSLRSWHIGSLFVCLLKVTADNDNCVKYYFDPSLLSSKKKYGMDMNFDLVCTLTLTFDIWTCFKVSTLLLLEQLLCDLVDQSNLV